MSRSIHETWSEYRESARYRYTDRELRRKVLREMRESLYKKRRIKEVVLRDRTPGARPSESVTPDAIPIEVRDERPGVFYPASPADIRALLGRLPPDAYAGIRKIELCLGKERINEYVLKEEGELDPDPLTGRSGYEEFDGLYGPWLNGTRFGDGTIQLYAYVKTKELEHWPVVELYLRKCMLETFLHELAHHQDAMIRVGRGRWRMDDEDRDEVYARAQGDRWKREHVVPCLEAAHPEQTRALLCWVEDRVGLHVPLTVLFDLDRDLIDGFHSFVESVMEGVADLTSLLLQYLVWNYHEEEALALFDRSSPEYCRSWSALAVKAEALERLARYDEAIEVARSAISLKSEGWLWSILLGSHTKRHAWQELLQETDQAQLALSPEELLRDTTWHRAVALINLGRFEEAVDPARRLWETPTRLGREASNGVVLAVALLGSQRFVEAHDVCTTVFQVARFRGELWKPELEACQFVANVHLGRFDLARSHPDLDPEKYFPWTPDVYSMLLDNWLPRCREKLGVP